MSEMNLTYEQAVGRLEEVVALLDKNDLPLEEALSLFEEGTKLTAFCTKVLREAKQIVLQAEKNDENND